MRVQAVAAGLATLLVACTAAPAAPNPTAPTVAATPPPPPPTVAAATPAPTRVPPTAAPPTAPPTPNPLATQTPEPEVADYIAATRPMLEAIETSLLSIQTHLGLLRGAPLRFTEPGWRNQLTELLEDLHTANDELRTYGRIPRNMPTYEADIADVTRDIQFAVDEYTAMLERDPEGTHLTRGANAARSATSKVGALLSDLQRRSPRTAP